MTERGSPDEGLRRLTRPKWVVGTVVVVLLVALMVSLGFWQLRRHDERAAQNDRVRERSQEPARPFADLVSLSGTDPDDVEYELVSVSGEYLADEEILIRNRTRDGLPGWHVATPLRLDDGSIVVVNRGWIPFVRDDLAYEPAGGNVTVRGLVFKSQVKGRFAATDSSGGELRDMARIDLPRISQQLDGPLYPVYVQLEAQDPAPGDLPAPIDRPALDAGPHLSYAVQWFIFSAIAAGGWGLLVRRELARPAGAARRSSKVPVDDLVPPLERTP